MLDGIIAISVVFVWPECLPSCSSTKESSTGQCPCMGVFISKGRVKSCYAYCISETGESRLGRVPSKNNSSKQFLESLTVSLFFESTLIKNAPSGSGWRAWVWCKVKGSQIPIGLLIKIERSTIV